MAIRLDIAPLNRIFSGVMNSITGVGTSRDGAAAWDIARTQQLSTTTLGELGAIGGFFDALINWLPDGCGQDWMKILLSENNYDLTEGDIEGYFADLKCDATNCFPLRTAFIEAARLARQEGNAYIVLGIADGLDPSEPVALDNIQSLQWAKVMSRDEMVPVDYWGAIADPPYYRVYQQAGDRGIQMMGKWHQSRVLRFSGHKLTGQALWSNGGEDHSVIEPCLESWGQWKQSHGASAAMLTNYSMGVLKAEGLNQGLEDDLATGDNANAAYYQQKLSSFARWLSNLRVALIDKDKEDFSFVERSYAGVPDIIRTLTQALVADCPDTPSHILLNQTQDTSKALSTVNTAGQAQRFEEAQRKRDWVSKHWIGNYTRAVRYVLAAKDGPTNGMPVDFECVSASVPLYTESERLTMQMDAASRDETLVAIGAITPAEVRSQFESPEWTGDIVLQAPVGAVEQVADTRTDAAVFQPPKGAQENARRVLKWKREHPDEIKGMTPVGWRRATQLASGEKVSLDIVKRMAQFNRHRQNGQLREEFRGEPWKQAGYVAWFGWGGDAGVDWAKRISEREDLSDADLVFHADALNVEPTRWVNGD